MLRGHARSTAAGFFAAGSPSSRRNRRGVREHREPAGLLAQVSLDGQMTIAAKDAVLRGIAAHRVKLG